MASVKESIDGLVEKARVAYKEFLNLNSDQVDEIVKK